MSANDEYESPVRKPGRPKGSVSKLSKAAREAAEATGKLPHEILLDIARGEIMYQKQIDPLTKKEIEVPQYPDLEMRLDAASRAAPYYAPKLATVELIQGMSDEDLDAIIAATAAEVASGNTPDGADAEAEEEGAASEQSAEVPASTRRRFTV